MPAQSERSTRLPVELVDWPEQRGLRKALAYAGVPRVLLIGHGCSPPSVVGVDEDWAWVDASDEEIDGRARALLERLRNAGDPELKPDGTWAYAGRTVRFPRVQSRLLEELVAHRGTPVTRRRLVEVAWPGRVVRRCSLEVAIGRLRERLVGTGLCVRSVRGVGYELA